MRRGATLLAGALLWAGACGAVGVPAAEAAAPPDQPAPPVSKPVAAPDAAPAPVELPPPAHLPPAPGGRPRLALVLSGGGARGAAHVGVLKVLEELHVRPDIIVGTSMGSIVGGLYAAGYSPDQLEHIIADTDWKDIFVDSVDRRDRSYRRKQDDATFLVPGKLRFKGWTPYIPPAVFGGQQLELFLRSLEIEARASGDFDNLPIPYRAVALDLETGKGVILDHGSIASAMRASMAVPGMFSPVEIDGKRLVDGGAAANLPVGIAQSLGADAVIAVDITSPLYSSKEIQSFFSVMSQWSSFSTVSNRLEDIKRLRPGDVLISPELDDINFLDFTRAVEAIGMGEQAARASADALKRFAVSDAEWEEFTRRHRTRSEDQLIVDKVKITNTSWVDDRVIEHRLKIPTGQPFDQKSFDHTVMKLYGLDYFGLIRHKYEREDGQGTISLDIPEKPYGRNSVQFGASFQDDFSGGANYTFALRHLLIAANRRGGEWENVGQIGQTRLLSTSFYQPLDYGMHWFVSPTARMQRDSIYLWDGDKRIAEVGVETNYGVLDAGAVLGDWGEVRLGAFDAHSHSAPITGDPSIGTDEEHDVGARLSFRVDTRDSTVFPREGVQVNAWYRDSYESMGADADRQVARLDADIALTFGRVTLVPSFSGQTLVTGPVSYQSSCALGGFLSLSGLGVGQLRGERCVLGRGIAYVRLSHLDLGPLSTAMYGGLSVETGNVYTRGDTVDWNSLILGGSVFVGAQTPLGPAFVAWGTTEDGQHSIYFVIGDRF
jgi:NTE family protein